MFKITIKGGRILFTDTMVLSKTGRQLIEVVNKSKKELIPAYTIEKIEINL